MTQPTVSKRRKPEDVPRIRQSQALFPYGTGAMLNVDGEWFVAVDTRRWGDRGIRLIREPRLMSLLRVSELRAPPFIDQSAKAELAPFRDESVPFYRFPAWMFCPTCHRMQRWQNAKAYRFCRFCAGEVRLSPMPFVQICNHGHLQDVNWADWVHRPVDEDTPGEEEGAAARNARARQAECRSDDEMKYTFRDPDGPARTTSFGVVTCHKCKARKPLLDLLESGAVYRLRCHGRQPWQAFEQSQPCEATDKHIVELASSELWYPVIERALDIPPNSDAASSQPHAQRIFGHAQFAELKDRLREKGRSRRATNLAIDIAASVSVPPADVLDYAERDLAEETGQDQVGSASEDLRPDELEAILRPDRVHHPRDRFIKRFVSLDDAPANPRSPLAPAVRLLKESITAVVQVQRLRMVMAYKGFTRVQDLKWAADQGDDGAQPVMVRPDLTSKLSGDEPLPWLPAIDLYGEGIFFSFDAARLDAWAAQQRVRARWDRLTQREDHPRPELPEAQPAFGLLHTLSHLLIRQMSYEAGYSLTALNERLYILPERKQYGLLIYTATIDVLGTLGGLVRLAEPDRLFVLMLKALQRGLWCSSDPLCAESIGQGRNGLNLAACHSCALIPETSCEHNNTRLDRVLLFGTPDRALPGYFEDVIASLPSLGI